MNVTEIYHTVRCLVHSEPEKRTVFKIKRLYKSTAQLVNVRLLRSDNRDIYLHSAHRNDARLAANDPCADLHKRIKLCGSLYRISKLVCIYAHSLFKEHTCRVVVLKTVDIMYACKIDPQLRIRHRISVHAFKNEIRFFLFAKALCDLTRRSFFKYLLSCYTVTRQVFLKHYAFYRVAAKRKKVIVHADSFKSEQILKSLADKLFLLSPWSFVFYRKILGSRCLQSLSVQLAVWRHRELIDSDDKSWYHIRRQRLCKLPSYLLVRQLLVCRVVSADISLPIVVSKALHYGIVYPLNF